VVLGAQAVLQGIARRARLAFRGLRALDSAPFLRLASARAGLSRAASEAATFDAAARDAALGLDMAGFLAGRG
jgi:hypothetical protein